MAKINQLTTLKIARLAKKPGRYADGLNLYLLVRRPGDASWVFRYMVAGRSRDLGLGALHSVSLSEARVRAREARQCLLDGRDPLDVKRDAAAAAHAERLRTVSFAEACDQFLSTPKVIEFRNDKHRKQWRSTLETLFPALGNLPLQSIDAALVLQAIKPVFERTPETGSRLLGRVRRVFDWASGAPGLFRGDNPAAWDKLKDSLPRRPKTQHHRAMPYADLPSFMSKLRERDSVSARALELTILTACRTQEIIGAKWSEIDLDAATWVIPASRMKAARDHRVPLSKRAVDVLRDLGRAPGKTRPAYVFINGGGLPLSNQAMSELLKGMIGGAATVHGFRSSFSDWARDRTAYPRDVVEQALAHVIKDKSEAAYRRGDGIDKRRRLMSEWQRYLDHDSRETGTVHKIGAARSA